MKTFCCTLLLLLGCALHRGAEGYGCRSGFHTHGGSCYWFSNMKGTFAEARSICRFLGSDLASITSAAENAFIRGYAAQTGKAEVYYVGGSDLSLEGSWRWTGNQLFTFTNWGPGQPRDSENDEDCLALQKSDEYRWHDYPCDFITNFICEM
ncbi:perlucin-like [Haliotis cracherodii]|uniref:perlucin-like n=1 Tax=Haliotis cracherodii TaxID=6455 RepID=UPI0039E8386F